MKLTKELHGQMLMYSSYINDLIFDDKNKYEIKRAKNNIQTSFEILLKKSFSEKTELSMLDDYVEELHELHNSFEIDVKMRLVILQKLLQETVYKLTDANEIIEHNFKKINLHSKRLIKWMDGKEKINVPEIMIQETKKKAELISLRFKTAKEIEQIEKSN